MASRMSRQKKVTFYQPDGTTLEGAKNVDGTKEKPGAIPQLLNMDAGQFMQVAMIAQGEFWKLLNAKTNERTEILRTIFQTDAYKKLELKLKNRMDVSFAARKEREQSISQSFREVKGRASGDFRRNIWNFGRGLGGGFGRTTAVGGTAYL